MRKIEEKIQNALRLRKNFKGDNTEVIVSDAGNIQILLHGSPIVRIENDENDIFISLAGWNTNTTRNRINTALNFYHVSRIYNLNRLPHISGKEISSRGWFKVMHAGSEIPAKAV
jgi:hypothetical protein